MPIDIESIIRRSHERTVARNGLLFVAILVTSAFLWNVTYAGAQRSQLETSIELEVQELLDEEGHENVSLVNVQVEQDPTSLSPSTEKVTVIIARPPGESNETLHRDINERVESQIGRDVPTEIQVTLITSH